jgi:hypothetical protein
MLSFGSALSQCNQFYQFKNGQTLIYTSYNKKGKMVQKEVQEVTEYEATADGFDMQIKTTSFDKKDEKTVSGTLDITCSNGVYSFDVRNFVNDEMMQAFYGMEVTVEGTPLEVPNSLSVGQTLPSGDCTITAGSEGSTFLTLTVTVEDRKVTGRESVTTEAGTFDCFVIEQNVTSKMIFKQTFNTKEYLAKDVGPVRVETYNKSGNLVSTRDLTAIE